MFRGQFVHTLDPKGRISLPARFREALESTGDCRVVVTKSIWDPCLHLYSLAGWEKHVRDASQLPKNNQTAITYRRLYISPAVDLEMDAAGRIVLPPDFRTKAELGKEALWAGMGDLAELWSKPRFDAATAMTDAELSDFRTKVQELIQI